MTTKPAHAHSDDAPVHRIDACSLIRQLTAHAHALSSESAPDRGDAAVGDQILLQIDVDGVRCVLIRRPDHGADVPMLSPREYEIAELIAHGHQTKTIAARLNISVWTVNTHIRRIFAKFGVTSRAAIARHVAAHAPWR